MSENKGGRGLVLGLDEDRDQDNNDTPNVDPDRGGVHDSNVFDEEGVDESVDDEDRKVDQNYIPALVYPSRLERNDRAQQQRQTEINSYQDVILELSDMVSCPFGLSMEFQLSRPCIQAFAAEFTCGASELTEQVPPSSDPGIERTMLTSQPIHEHEQRVETRVLVH